MYNILYTYYIPRYLPISKLCVYNLVIILFMIGHSKNLSLLNSLRKHNGNSHI